VPGFGAFLTEIQPAQLNESSNAFYPPKKVVSFNSHLRNNDGLLANHIAEYEKSTYDQAVDLISGEVTIWKQILEINEKFSLKNIGELTLNSEKNLVFSPYEQSNYLKEAFGLSSFVSPAVKREVYKQEVEAIEEKAPIIFTPEKRKNRAFLRYAAIITLTLGLTGSVGYKIYQKTTADKALIVEKAVQREVQGKIQEATFLIENPIPAVTLTVKNEKLSYHIVASAFRNEQNARIEYNKLNKKGYNARMLPRNKHGLYPVLYGSYSSSREAWKALANIKATQNKDAWLLVKEF
jgi:hypothetical protein